MGRYDRSIKIAFDKVSGEILEADEVFSITKDAFEIRRLYHEKNLLLSCCECEQDLIVSGSKNDNLHFKHKPGSDYCVLADGRLTLQEQDRYTAILKSKESDRHKELKSKIGALLKTVNGVDLNSIAIDNKFMVKENGKRRPDVYCTYFDKELVFEIQLSDLSLGYILNRYEFYKEHGIYLIWILDNFDIHNQGTLERDIKYLSKYHNFFKLDEQSDSLKLLCEYKFPFLTDNNRFVTKWIKKSVELKELKFDNIELQAYYYNYSDNCKSVETIQKKIAKATEDAERKELEKIQLDNANSKAKKIVNSIKLLRERGAQYFGSICTELEDLNLIEVKALNENLKFRGRVVGNKPPLIKWIDEAKKDDAAFLQFILKAREIELDINVTDNSGRSPVQAIINNPNLDNSLILRSLFGAGYNLSENDIEFLTKMKDDQLITASDIQIYKFCNAVSKRNLVGKVFEFLSQLFIIESAKQKKLVHFNFTGNKWVSFAVNAIQYYSGYWEYIELAFRKYGLWDMIIESDRKGTFQRRLETFYSNMPEQYYDFDDLFKDLYPELETSRSQQVYHISHVK